MADRDGYPAGVPCWVDTSQPDPQVAASFYGGLFGWDIEDAMPPGSPSPYLIGRLRGRDVAAIASQPEGAPAAAAWNTYVAVDSADAAAERVRAAGGKVLTDPFDVPRAGRMAIFTDPDGAAFRVWEAREHKGAGVVNEHGSLNFNTLNVRDVERARSFYGSVFGWEVLELDGGAMMWTLPGYGDRLEEDAPGLRERIAELGAAPGFEDVVASLLPVGAGRTGTSPHWSVTFGVDDADAIAERAAELGGTVVVPPFDAPWVRMAVIADPLGAVFTASRFVPENRDLAGSVDSAASAA